MSISIQYYAHRKKLRDIGREDDLERLNRNALRLAREVAEASGSLLAGGICDTGLYHHDDLSNVDEIKDIFKVRTHTHTHTHTHISTTQSRGFIVVSNL